MATLSFLNLVGDPEPFEETVRAFIARSWTAANTKGNTPKFISPHGIDTEEAVFDTSKISPTSERFSRNKELIRFKSRREVRLTQESSDDSAIMLFETPIDVYVFADSEWLRFLYEREINNILENANPGSYTRIKKSNNTQNSAIDNFRVNHIEFTDTNGWDDTRTSWNSVGTLYVRWYQSKT